MSCSRRRSSSCCARMATSSAPAPALMPDEAALSSTVWMCGVFNSLLTQGHVNINRFVAATHGYLDLAKADGQRIFVETPRGLSAARLAVGLRDVAERVSLALQARGRADRGARHCALDRPRDRARGPCARRCRRSAFSSRRASRSTATTAPLRAVRFDRDGPAWSLDRSRTRRSGAAFRRAAFASTSEPAPRSTRSAATSCSTPRSSRAASRSSCSSPRPRSRPRFVSPVISSSRPRALSSLRSRAPSNDAESAGSLPARPCFGAARSRLLAPDVARLGEILPWLADNALIHYLAPHGLEQYAGGGWGTRDVCQGPVEHLLALGEHAVLRDLLLRVFANQNPDGDWPQWFMFFDRERGIRAPDSHGDIVFWPLLALGRVPRGLRRRVDSRDAHCRSSTLAATTRPRLRRSRCTSSVRSRSSRRRVIRRYPSCRLRQRRLERLAAAGSIPSMKERLTSAWTVTLHFHTLRTLADRASGDRPSPPDASLSIDAADGYRADFRSSARLDGTVAGLAYFHDDARIDPLLHPRDTVTGISYSLLPMIHSILHDLFTPAEAASHREIIRSIWSRADGARLFDGLRATRAACNDISKEPRAALSSAARSASCTRTLTFATPRRWRTTGTPTRSFSRFAKRIRSRSTRVVPTAAPRQANCYYSSSDAAFADRYEASARYATSTAMAR